MVEIPDALRTLFTARVEERDGEYVVRVPRAEVERDAVAEGGVYRVAVLPSSEAGDGEDAPVAEPPAGEPQSPPVDEGDRRRVSVETTGDQGDGIAKVDRGYVVIVPGGEPGDSVTVEIARVHENFAIGEIVE